ncbi:alpha/beta hydrolase [Microbacteriaceae bacterium VKM Ac-2855]|nr:alpha/beta hydrolase [Microbacteriaceae bacterium VKM Ac-2855]
MSSIPAIDSLSRMGAGESRLPAYCPFPLRSSAPERVGLWRRVVPSVVGPVVVHAGRVAGAPATILLHGAAGSWSTWTPLLEASDDTATPLTDVIAIDLPGWGESALPDAIDVQRMSETVAEVARSLGYERWNVIGHSLGGVVALDLAASYPAATLSVGLVSGTGTGVVEAVRHPLRGGSALPGFAGMLLAMRILALFGSAGVALVRGLFHLGLLPALAAPLFARRRRIDATVIEALSTEIRPRSFAVAARSAAEYRLDRWRWIRCPVRSVRGADDVFVGPADAAGFASRIRDFRETVLPGAGHFAAVEQPFETLAALGQPVSV